MVLVVVSASFFACDKYTKALIKIQIQSLDEKQFPFSQMRARARSPRLVQWSTAPFFQLPYYLCAAPFLFVCMCGRYLVCNACAFV